MGAVWWWVGVSLVVISTLAMVFLLRAYHHAQLMRMPAIQLWLQEGRRFPRVKAPAKPAMRLVPRPVEWLFFDFAYEDGAWVARGKDGVYRGSAGPREAVPTEWNGADGQAATGSLKESLDMTCRQAIVSSKELPSSEGSNRGTAR